MRIKEGFFPHNSIFKGKFFWPLLWNNSLINHYLCHRIMIVHFACVYSRNTSFLWKVAHNIFSVCNTQNSIPYWKNYANIALQKITCHKSLCIEVSGMLDFCETCKIVELEKKSIQYLFSITCWIYNPTPCRIPATVTSNYLW